MPAYDISLSVPSGALEKGTKEEIGLRILSLPPPTLKLKSGDMLICYCFECTPSGVRFLKPVELTLPHCAIVTEPKKAKFVLYCGSPGENG